MTSTTPSTAPSSSPRLPSPPPFTEVQIMPSTPLNIPSSKSNAASGAATRRIRPGTKSRNVDTGLPLTCLSELDSAFQLQEHLASLLSSITNPPGSDRTFPLTRADCERLATPPEGVEENLWCYELTRRLTRDLNVLIVALLNDKCTAATCPEMRASEWQYLCAVHESPQSCCAIDYSTHTLDQAATMLTSTKYFPSRLSLHQASVKHLASIFRRLYRIFAHAWFQHRHVFWDVEGEHGLYLFFKTVSDRYRLIPQDSLMLPPEAEGLKDKNGDAAEEESEEEDFEWDRGLGSEGHLEPVGDGEEKEDSDEEGEGEYSDESDSDDELVAGDDDGDIIDDDIIDDEETQEEEAEMIGEQEVKTENAAEKEQAGMEKASEEDTEALADEKEEGEPKGADEGVTKEVESEDYSADPESEGEPQSEPQTAQDSAEEKSDSAQGDASDAATEHKSEEETTTNNDDTNAEPKDERKHEE